MLKYLAAVIGIVALSYFIVTQRNISTEISESANLVLRVVRTGMNGEFNGQELERVCGKDLGKYLVFCREGFYLMRYGKNSSSYETEEQFFAELIRIEKSVPQEVRIARALGFGMALGEAEMIPASKDLNGLIEAYFYDGWGIARAFQEKSASYEGLCQSLATLRQRRYCRYGVGRAAFFIGHPRPAENSDKAFFNGYGYAKGFVDESPPGRGAEKIWQFAQLMLDRELENEDSLRGCMQSKHLLECVE